jgi:hypothetical protein
MFLIITSFVGEKSIGQEKDRIKKKDGTRYKGTKGFSEENGLGKAEIYSWKGMSGKEEADLPAWRLHKSVKNLGTQNNDYRSKCAIRPNPISGGSKSIFFHSMGIGASLFSF